MNRYTPLNGIACRDLRKRIKLTQQELANALGISLPTVQRYERERFYAKAWYGFALQWFAGAHAKKHVLVQLNGLWAETNAEDAAIWQFRQGLYMPDMDIQFWHELPKSAYPTPYVPTPKEPEEAIAFPPIDPSTWDKP